MIIVLSYDRIDTTRLVAQTLGLRSFISSCDFAVDLLVACCGGKTEMWLLHRNGTENLNIRLWQTWLVLTKFSLLPVRPRLHLFITDASLTMATRLQKMTVSPIVEVKISVLSLCAFLRWVRVCSVTRSSINYLSRIATSSARWCMFPSLWSEWRLIILFADWLALWKATKRVLLSSWSNCARSTVNVFAHTTNFITVYRQESCLVLVDQSRLFANWPMVPKRSFPWQMQIVLCTVNSLQS